MSFISYAIFDTTNGVILRTGFCTIDSITTQYEPAFNEDWIEAANGENGGTHYVSNPNNSAKALTALATFNIAQDVTSIPEDGSIPCVFSNVPAETTVVLPDGSTEVTAAAPATDTVSVYILSHGGYNVGFSKLGYAPDVKFISVYEVLPWE